MVLKSCCKCTWVYQSRSFLQHLPQFAPPSRITSKCAATQFLPFRQHFPFTTSSALLKNPRAPKSKSGPLQSTKGTTTLKIKRKARPVKTGRSFTEGERKARRKTLVLANPSANKVALPTLTPEDATNIYVDGSLRAFDGDAVSRLRNLEGFHLRQGWELFYTPSVLIRAESVELGGLIGWTNGEKDVEPGVGAYELDKEDAIIDDWAKTVSHWKSLASKSKSVTRVIHGPKGSGKSVLLLQAMAWAIQRQWLVITIPDTQDLVIGHTEYEHDLISNLWVQKQYTAALLRRVLLGNRAILEKVPLSRTFAFMRDEVAKGKTLIRLVELGANDSTISWDVFLALLDELALPGRPPVLFTLDNLNLISVPTKYRNTSFKPIHAHDLALPALFLDYLTGRRSFWRGVILAATCCSNSPQTEALDYALRGEIPSPYEKVDPRIAPSIEGAPVLKLNALTREQAKALMIYYKDSGIYTQDVDSTLAEKYALSSGNPKELLASCKRLKF